MRIGVISKAQIMLKQQGALAAGAYLKGLGYDLAAARIILFGNAK